MSALVLRNTVFWLAGLVVAVLVIDALEAALWPFLAGMVIAYLLDPIADRLEAIGCPRSLAAALIVLVFVVALIAVVVVVVPALIAQAVDLAARLPGYLEQLRAFIQPQIAELQAQLSPEMADRLRDTLRTAVGDVFGWIAGVLRGLLGSGVALVNLLSVLVIMPLVAFYLLRDWDRIVGQVGDLVPRPLLPTVATQMREIDARLSGFVRGQALVCLALAVWYSAGLSLVGLDFGLVVGMTAGLIAFIPYISTILGVATGLGLALAQFDSAGPVIAVAGVFAVGQVAQDFVLVPRLIGDRVGLHPAWVLFALMAGGTAFGFTGVLLAVPGAAVIGVLIRFAVDRYRASDAYGADRSSPGESPRPAAAAGDGGPAARDAE